MSNLDDLGIESITDMTTDEALELIRQTRLRRRTPVKTVKKTTAKSTKPPKTFDTSTLSEEEKAEIVKLLMGD